MLLTACSFLQTIPRTVSAPSAVVPVNLQIFGFVVAYWCMHAWLQRAVDQASLPYEPNGLHAQPL